MLTARICRRIKLKMESAVEGAHMGHPDFRVNGRLLSSLSADNKRGLVKLLPDQQQEFVQANPGAFEPSSGAWGLPGSTSVRLGAVEEETLGAAMTLAWQHAVTKPAAGRRQHKR